MRNENGTNSIPTTVKVQICRHLYFLLNQGQVTKLQKTSSLRPVELLPPKPHPVSPVQCDRSRLGVDAVREVKLL